MAIMHSFLTAFILHLQVFKAYKHRIKIDFHHTGLLIGESLSFHVFEVCVLTVGGECKVSTKNCQNHGKDPIFFISIWMIT